MPPVAPQPVQLTCPSCGTSFRTGIYTLVDVTQQPELKSALLGGQLNVAVCPNCRTASMLGAPMVYHDAEKQLFLLYFPQELNSRPEDQERFVGEASTFIMRSLPAEAPRAYLLAPRRFLTIPSLIDAIFEGDGISRESLDRQRQQVELISELASALVDEDQFKALVHARRAELTPEFLATLAAFIDATPPTQGDSRGLLIQVQEHLLAVMGDPDAPSDDEVAATVERLIAVSDDDLPFTVADQRDMIDYGFYQLWTERIEAAEAAGNTEEATRLSERRASILTIVEDIDRQAQAIFEAGNALIGEIFELPDPVAALNERADRVDESFVMVLSANAAAAQRAGRDDLLARFEQIGEAAIAIIHARLTPEERFINELLMVETPQEATKLLRKNVAKINPALIKQLNELADQEEKRANKPTADRLRQLARESGAMLF
jgi:hypothetical protein